MQSAIKNGFDRMDEEIVNAPVRLLEKMQKEGKVARPIKEIGGGMSLEQTEALTTLLPALSGSCALLAFLDAGRNKCASAVAGAGDRCELTPICHCEGFTSHAPETREQSWELGSLQRRVGEGSGERRRSARTRLARRRRRLRGALDFLSIRRGWH